MKKLINNKMFQDFSVVQLVNNLPAKAGDAPDPWFWKIPHAVE